MITERRLEPPEPTRTVTRGRRIRIPPCVERRSGPGVVRAILLGRTIRDSIHWQSKLSEPRRSVPVTPLNPNLAVRDVEEFAPAQPETTTGRGVSGKLAAKCAAEAPLHDGPLAILENVLDLSATVGNPYWVNRVPLLPWLSLQLDARNAGGGVIAYTTRPSTELVAFEMVLAYEVAKATAALAADKLRAVQETMTATLIDVIGGFAL